MPKVWASARHCLKKSLMAAADRWAWQPTVGLMVAAVVVAEENPNLKGGSCIEESEGSGGPKPNPAA